jgi:hypothetical protein
MGIFSKKVTPISSSDFEKQVTALVICGRLAGVNNGEMAQVLAKHAAGLQREIVQAREARSMRLT